MKTIGGFFELEINTIGAGFHPMAAALTSGRACLAWILSELRPKRVYLPFYSCDAMLQPLRRLGIDHEFYRVTSELLPEPGLVVGENDCLLVVDYFGLCGPGLDALKNSYGRRLIFDNTQNFFNRGSSPGWSFNSARKFFGVPDGAYLYGPAQPPSGIPRNDKIQWNHLIERWLGRQDEAYGSFLASEGEVTSDVLGISALSEAVMAGLPYEKVQERRRSNYLVYDAAFHGINVLGKALGAGEVPFCYPLLMDREVDRTQLYSRGIFVPTLWPEVGRRDLPGFDFEKSLARRLLPLPLDHRYTNDDCLLVIDAVKALIDKA